MCFSALVARKKNMRLLDIRNRYVYSLANLYDKSETEKIFVMMAEDIMEIKHTDYFRMKEKNVSAEFENLFELALQRLKTAEPVQYILGYAWFLDYKIKVNKDVLIPRPETEELVTQLLYNNKKFTGTILDIGTGSGCIAIAIKKLLPEAKIFAVDVSAAALNVAKQNATDNNCEINFIV